MQVVQVDATDGKLTPQTDGSLKVTGATDVRIVVTGYSDYLPMYPSFKGRDFRADCEKTLSAAGELGYDALRDSHVADVSALMNHCRLELDFRPSGFTTDKLVVDGGSLELENLYFNYTRYLQLSCSRNAPVPSNLQGLWNADLKPAWNCDYHTDINVQMNYWMVDPANLPGRFGRLWSGRTFLLNQEPIQHVKPSVSAMAGAWASTATSTDSPHPTCMAVAISRRGTGYARTCSTTTPSIRIMGISKRSTRS
jgi:hypothetical protein